MSEKDKCYSVGIDEVTGLLNGSLDPRHKRKPSDAFNLQLMLSNKYARTLFLSYGIYKKECDVNDEKDVKRWLHKFETDYHTIVEFIQFISGENIEDVTQIATMEFQTDAAKKYLEGEV